jgi:hypothetical protein
VVKRVLDLTGSELARISAKDFKSAVLSAEGRTIAAEVVVTAPPLIDGVSNVELASSFGADIILLNMFDVFNPKVEGVPERYSSVSMLSEFLHRFIGHNLEPVNVGVLPPGRTLTDRSVSASLESGSKLIVVTGNPGLGVTWDRIIRGVELVRSIGGDRVLVFGGKMHSGGLRTEEMYDLKLIEEVLARGADGVVIPAPYTVPGSLPEKISTVAKLAYKYDAVVMCTIGTSQEGSQRSVIRKIGLSSKACGCDIHHIGDSGYGMRVALPENILELSLAVRGVRHTYRRIAMSYLR